MQNWSRLKFNWVFIFFFPAVLCAQIEESPLFVEEDLPGEGKIERFQDGYRYGYRTSEGKVFVPALYTVLPPTPYSVMVVTKKGEAGVIDYRGNELIPFGVYDKLELKQPYQFERTDSRGVQWVKDPIQLSLMAYQNGRVGLINPLGKVVVPLQFERGRYLEGRYYAFFREEQWQVFNSRGAALPEAVFDWIQVGGKGLWHVGRGGKEGLFALPDTFVLPLEYDALVYDLEESHYRVTKGDKVGTFDPATGELELGTGPSEGSWEKQPFNDSYSLIREKSSDLVGLWHQDRGVLIPPRYTSIQPQGAFTWFLVRYEEGYALFDTLGKQLTPFAYKSLAATAHNQELAHFSREDTKGLLRIRDGREVAAGYAHIFGLTNGYFKLSDGHLYALGSPEGEQLTEFMYADLQPEEGSAGQVVIRAYLEDFQQVCLDGEGIRVSCTE